MRSKTPFPRRTTPGSLARRKVSILGPAWRSRSATALLLTLLVPLGGLAACDAIAPGHSPGEKLYRKRCADCHGVDGQGQTVRFMGNTWANIVDEHWRYGGDPASMEHTLRTEAVFQHPSFDDLSATEVKQIVRHVAKLGSSSR